MIKTWLKFNEGNNVPIVKTWKDGFDVQTAINKMDEIDKEAPTSDTNKYYVGSVSEPGYAFYHGTFKGFKTRREVIEYFNKISKTAKTIRVLSPGEWLKIKKVRDQGQ